MRKIFCKRIDILFFYLFLLTSTLSVRKVLHYYPINNSFNEYTGVYIYLSDIFLFLTFFFWLLYILNHNYYFLSSISTGLSRCLSIFFKLFHVEQFKEIRKIFFRDQSHISFIKILRLHCSTWNNFQNSLFKKFANIKTNIIVPRGTIIAFKKLYPHFVNNFIIFFPLFMGFFALLSILWASNKPIAIFRSIKLSEFIFLYYYLVSIVPRGTIEKYSASITKIDYQNCSTWNNRKKTMTGIPNVFAESCPKCDSNLAIKKNCSTWNNLKTIFIIVIFTGLLQSLIGIMQTIFQQSIGLFWLKESLISSSLPGVAKIILGDHAYIRAYGLFPHPNIFGGYLVFSIIVTLLFIKLFHAYLSGRQVEQFKSEQDSSISNCSTWNNSKLWLSDKLKKYFVPRGTLFLKLAVVIQLSALLLTFSKSAIFGLFAGLSYIYIKGNGSIVPRGTINKTNSFDCLSNCSTWNIIKSTSRQLFHVEQFKKFILITSIFITLSILIKPDLNSLFFNSLQERILYLNVSRGTFLENPILGIGSGQFVSSMVGNISLANWQYQPVHNVFMLILNEFGLIMLIFFIYFVYRLFNNSLAARCSTWNILAVNKKSEPELSIVPRGTLTNINICVINQISFHLKAILLSFLFVFLFDHYMWDIQQGIIILWFVLGLTKALQLKKSV